MLAAGLDTTQPLVEVDVSHNACADKVADPACDFLQRIQIIHRERMPPGKASGNLGRMCYGPHNDLEREKQEKGVEGIGQNLPEVIALALVRRIKTAGQKNIKHVSRRQNHRTVPESIIPIPFLCICKR